MNKRMLVVHKHLLWSTITWSLQGKWQEARKTVILVLGMLITVVSENCHHLTKMEELYKWHGPGTIVLSLAMVTHAFYSTVCLAGLQDPTKHDLLIIWSLC